MHLRLDCRRANTEIERKLSYGTFVCVVEPKKVSEISPQAGYRLGKKTTGLFSNVLLLRIRGRVMNKRSITPVFLDIRIDR